MLSLSYVERAQALIKSAVFIAYKLLLEEDEKEELHEHELQLELHEHEEHEHELQEQHELQEDEHEHELQEQDEHDDDDDEDDGMILNILSDYFNYTTFGVHKSTRKMDRLRQCLAL